MTQNSPEARAALAAIIERKAEAEGRKRAAETAIARLEAAAAVESPIAAELAALDASDARALDEWSKTASVTPPPCPDVDRRRDLETRLAAARATAAAARTASEGPRSEINRAQAEIAEINVHAAGLAAIIALGEIEHDAEVVKRAAVELAIRQQKLGAARHAILLHVESLPHDRRPRDFFIALEALDARVRDALAAPAPNQFGETARADEIRHLLARLPVNASATTII